MADQISEDVVVIKDVIALQRVQVLADLHWDKLQEFLKVLSDRVASQSLRLDKAEGQGTEISAFKKDLLALKEEVNQKCTNAVKECKDATQTGFEQSKHLEGRLNKLEEGLQEAASQFKQVDEALKSLDLNSSQRLHSLENLTKVLNNGIVELQQKLTEQEKRSLVQDIKVREQCDKVEENSKALSALEARLSDVEGRCRDGQGKQKEQDQNLSQQLNALKQEFEILGSQVNKNAEEMETALHSLDDEVEALHSDLLNQDTRRQLLETQGAELKALMQQSTKFQATDFEELRTYCQNVCTNLENKVQASSPTERRSSITERRASLSKPSKQDLAQLEAAIVELQERLQKKADVTVVDELKQAAQDVTDAVARMRRGSITSAPPRRTSRVSLTLSSNGAASLVSLPASDELKETLQNHEKLFEKVFDAIGSLGKGVLIMSGHNTPLRSKSIIENLSSLPSLNALFGKELARRMSIENADSVQKAPTEQQSDNMLSHMPESKPPTFETEDSPDTSNAAEIMAPSTVGNAGPMLDVKGPNIGTAEEQNDQQDISRSTEKNVYPEQQPAQKFRMDNVNYSHGSTIEGIYNTTGVQHTEVVKDLERALKENKIQPKEDSKTLAELMQGLEELGHQFEEACASILKLKNEKADKKEYQKIARLVAMHLQGSDIENAMFTGKPLLGFRCLSCESPIENLNPERADYVPTNVMPKQLLPMFSAERIFTIERISPRLQTASAARDILQFIPPKHAKNVSPYTTRLPKRAQSAGANRKIKA